MSTQENSQCATNNCNKFYHIAIVVLLVATLGTAIWAGYQPTKMETLKVGGKENFEKLQTIMKSAEYKEQYAQSLDLMLQQLNGTDQNITGNEDMMINPEEISTGEESMDSNEVGTDTGMAVDPSTDNGNAIDSGEMLGN